MITSAVLAVVAIGIFLLTEQSVAATSFESSFVNDALVATFGWIPHLYDSDTGLWLGVDIRHWAHVVEFFLLGAFVTASVCYAAKPRLFAIGGISLAVCFVSSLFDQCHKLFVPGRHFDGVDLVMDAIGYIAAIVIVLLIAKAKISRDKLDGLQ